MTIKVHPGIGHFARCLLLAISGTITVGAFQLSLEHQLLQAVQAGNLERVQRLHRAGASIESSIPVNGGNTTALLEAIRADHVDVVQFLLCEGAPPDVFHPDRLGRTITPLAEAERLGHDEIYDLILDALIRQREGSPCPPSGG